MPMNRTVGMAGSLTALCATVIFAASMPTGALWVSYGSSMFIAFGFVLMMSAFAAAAPPDRRAAGYGALGFACAYAAVILVVYFTQLTAVRFGGLTEQAAALLDFQRFGLFFSCDLLGYALMALSTFFAGLTVTGRTGADRWLRALLIIHGVFFISCLVMPVLGVFRADGPAWAGVAALEFWCVYFCPVCVLSLLRFRRDQS